MRCSNSQSRHVSSRARRAVTRRALTERTDLREATRVDRERCVIYGVKVLGLVSANGRRYTREAIKEAARLYEGAKVKANHPDKPNATRDVDDTLGWFQGIEIREDGLYAREFHYLESHPLSARIVEAAERNPRLYGFSHNIQGDTRDEADGTEIVLRITEVRSVDLVDDPATTGGLFEGRKMKFQEFIGKLKVPALSTDKGKIVIKRLLESGMMDEIPPDLDMPAEDAPEEDHISALKNGFRAACLAVLDGDGDTKSKMKKLKDILAASDKLLASGQEVAEEDEDGETGADDGADDGEDDEENIEECDEDDEGEDMKEKYKREQKELRQLRAEKKGRALCEAAGITPDNTLLEALAALPSEDAQKRLIEREKARSKPAGQTPRSGVSGASKQTADAAEDLSAFVAAFRR